MQVIVNVLSVMAARLPRCCVGTAWYTSFTHVRTAAAAAAAFYDVTQTICILNWYYRSKSIIEILYYIEAIKFLDRHTLYIVLLSNKFVC